MVVGNFASDTPTVTWPVPERIRTDNGVPFRDGYPRPHVSLWMAATRDPCMSVSSRVSHSRTVATNGRIER
jgi:hypothetical protein